MDKNKHVRISENKQKHPPFNPQMKTNYMRMKKH